MIEGDLGQEGLVLFNLSLKLYKYLTKKAMVGGDLSPEGFVTFKSFTGKLNSFTTDLNSYASEGGALPALSGPNVISLLILYSSALPASR